MHVPLATDLVKRVRCKLLAFSVGRNALAASLVNLLLKLIKGIGGKNV